MKLIDSFLKIKKFFIFIFILFFPVFVFAQDINKTEIVFEAQVVEVLKQINNVLPDGKEVEQQNVKLRGLNGDYKNKDIVFVGIGDYAVAKNNLYKEGDKVLVLASFNEEGDVTYYITDYVRNNSLLYLSIIFVLTLIIISGLKGVRSIISLTFSFLVMIKYIIPQILTGANPLFVSLVGALLILFFMIYITEGFRKESHIAVVSIFISLIITIFLSYFFVNFAKLSGVSSEEVSFLIGLGGTFINFKGLLLAGIIIGTLGVLDDVVISQITAVEQILEANPNQNKKEIFSRAYKIGISHISSMTNTLFLAYAGVSLPLLILFISGESAFNNWGQVVNNEAIATEIVRTITGSIGLILSVPISTGIAVWWMSKKAKN